MRLSPTKEPDAMRRSLHVQSEASALGFDWPDVAGVLDKVQEELDEVREALSRNDRLHAGKELGDLLLAAVNLSRFLGANPVSALDGATNRFAQRVQRVCAMLQAEGRSPRGCTLEALDQAWILAKEQLKHDESGSA